MKRFLILSGLLFLAINLWSATASADYLRYGPQYGTPSFPTAQDYCNSEPYSTTAVINQPLPTSPSSNNTRVGDCMGGAESNVAYYAIYARMFSGDDPNPSCESPNYIDDESGECVAPEEICFTTIIDMASQCVYIGEPQPDVPDGCVIDSKTGAEICLSEDPLCYVANGKTICPTPDMVCGEKNGTFSCVKPEEEGCGYFNGEKICFTTDGDKVENDSPDHPDNGGNLDGDDTNDMFDSRDPTEGGDPDNQIDSTPPPTTDDDRSSESTARKQLQELKNLNKKMDEMGKGGNLDESKGSNKVDTAVPGLINDTGIDGLTSGIDVNPFGSSDLGTVPGMAEGLIPTGSCTAFTANILGFGTFSISCEDTNLLRTIIAWVLYVITAIYLFQLLTTPVRS